MAPEGLATIKIGDGYWLYQAVCRCGWSTKPVPTRTQADRCAATHKVCLRTLA